MLTTSRFSAVAICAVLMMGTGCKNAASDGAAKDSGAAPAAIAAPSGAAREVEVIGLDYAFSMPDSVDAGRTAFKFTNKGKVDHEYNIVLLKQGVTLQQFIDAANKKEPTTSLIDAPLGVLFAKPGRTSVSMLSAEMQPGRTYAVQCIFTDSAKAPTHRELGMFRSVTVRGNIPLVTPVVAIDTIIGTDYAYTKYPRTIAPGWHHFKFVNTGKQRHEISIALLKAGATLTQLLDVAGKDGDIDAFLDESLGVLHARPGIVPLGTLDFDVLPGREYVIVCTFQDTPKAPPHFALGMATSMVSSK